MILDGKDSIQIDIEEDNSDNRINVKREYLDDSVMNLVDKQKDDRSLIKYNGFRLIEPVSSAKFRTIEQQHEELARNNEYNQPYSTIGDRRDTNSNNILTTIGTVRRIKQNDVTKLSKVNEDP